MNDEKDKTQLTDQDRFTAIFEQSPLAIQILTPEGKTLRVNQAWENLWGVTLKQIGDYNILEDHQLIEKGVMPYIKKAFAGEVVHLPTVSYDPNDTIPAITNNQEPKRWTKATIYPLKDTQNNVREIILIHEDITEQKNIEQKSELLTQEISKQKKHLQELVSSVPGVVWEAWGEPDESNQRIDFVSDYVKQMLGYTVEEWLSTPNFWLRIVHEEDKEKAALVASQTYVSGEKGTNRFRWVAKDGSIVWVEAQSMVICDESGKPVGMRGVTMDITDRKKKENAERFLFEAGLALSSTLDYEKTLANVAKLAVPHFADWCTIDMVTDDEKLERLVLTHKNPEMIDWANKLYTKFPPKPDSPIGIYSVLRNGKSEFYPHISDELVEKIAQSEEHLNLLKYVGYRSAMLVPIKIRERVLGIISFFNTVSQNHTDEDLALAEDLANRAGLAIDNALLFRAEQSARREAQKNSEFLKRLQSVSGSLSQALILKDVGDAVIEQGIKSVGAHAGIVVMTDKGNKTLNIISTIGFSDEVVEKWESFDLDQRVPLADAIRTQTPIFIESFQSHTDEYPFLGPLASITNSNALVAFPLIMKGKTLGGLGLSFREIQNFSNDDRIFMLALAQQCEQALERARLYEIEQKLRAEAENANRIKDEFLATVSHELRTPLNAIVGWTSLLKLQQLNEKEVVKAVETIERNAKSQAQIIEDLLDISRIITGKLDLKFEILEFREIIIATIESLLPTAEAKQIKIETELKRSLFINADKGRLQQVLWNLLSNAIKFTPHNGNVFVMLELSDSFAKVSFRDDGQGIKPEFVPYVFERFRQADATTTRNHGGLGLGLSIVRNIVEMHEGFVEASSEGEGKGATFSVKIPIVSTDILSSDKQQVDENADENNRSLKGFRILVVDDEIDSLELLKAIIETNGGETKAVLSANEALDIFNEFDPHILISDIAMPQEDGYSLIRKIRSMTDERSKIPAIAVTAYTRESDKKRVLDAGFQTHIAKPIDHARLIEIIESFLT